MPLAVGGHVLSFCERMFVRAKKVEQREARRMREEGSSLREISEALGVALSSVSVWVRDVPRGADDPGPAADANVGTVQLKREEPLRRCGRCTRSLPESSFNRYRGGRQWWCRDCFREYFMQRGDLHRRQSARSKQRRVEAALELVSAYKRAHPCDDCGETNLVLLDFDHLREKVREISLMAAAGAPLDAIRTEIAKCEVVCANCHRRRTARRGDWVRSRKDWWRTAPPARDKGGLRNIAFAYSYLERSSCVDCGLQDLCVLEFDHISEKSAGVMRMAWNGASLQRLVAEIERCEVRCVNCHRVRTSAQRERLGVPG